MNGQSDARSTALVEVLIFSRADYPESWVRMWITRKLQFTEDAIQKLAPIE